MKKIFFFLTILFAINNITFSQNRGIARGEKELGGVILYPNPTTGELFVQSSKFKVQSVEIFDVYGRKVLVPPLTVLWSYYLTVLHPGIYFVRVGFEGGSCVKKLVKQ